MKQQTNDCNRPRVKVIDTHYLRPAMDASHLLIEDGEALFIDTGTAQATELLLTALAEEELRPDDVRYVVLTHIHLDHAGGAGALLQHCPNATLIVHPKGAAHMINPEKLIRASIDIYGAEKFAELYGSITPIDAHRVRETGDGATLGIRGRTLHLLDTPGHARHHLSIWDPAGRAVFSGDTLGLAYPELQLSGCPPFMMPTTSPAAFEPDVLEQSIKRLLSLRPQTCYLTHFGPVDPHPQAISRLIELVRQHAALGKSPERVDIPALAGRVCELLVCAYEDYCRENKETGLDRTSVAQLLAGDCILNAQGIAAWQARNNR